MTCFFFRNHSESRDVMNCGVFQVLSGGVVLELTAQQKVWLESYKGSISQQTSSDNNEKQIIFNGFLIFSNSE